MENGHYRAIYEDGVFKPTGNVELPEHTEVIVMRAVNERFKPDEPARQRVYELLSRSYQTGDPNLAARHDEHQP